MKPMLSIFIVMLVVSMAGCAGAQKSQPDVPSATPATQPLPEVSTAQGGGQAVRLPSSTPGGGEVSSPAALPAGGVTLAENGMTFAMQAGDSFLLNLGTEVYEWTDVQIDHQEVLQRKMGVLVIRGAQGIFVAQAPGTAVLTTNGDPLCLKAKPPCKLPSIVFSITLVVN